jgi:hypothetical protein
MSSASRSPCQDYSFIRNPGDKAMSREPEETPEKIRRQRDLYLEALYGLTRKDVTFTQEEIDDLKENGVPFEQVLEILKRDMEEENG